MKKIILLAAFLGLVFWGCAGTNSGHRGATTLDWNGTYVGTLPCADCEGILTSLTLGEDSSYTLATRYLGKDDKVFEERGRFSRSADGSTIHLENTSNTPWAYRIGENMLSQLDLEGQVISGELADRYVLRKRIALVPELSEKCLLDTQWRLVELLGKPVSPDNTKKSPFIFLNSKEKRFSGFGGCNTVSGGYELKAGGRLRFTGMASTLMACPDMDIEQELFRILAMTDNFACDGQTLFLHKARMAPLAKFTAIP